MVRASIRQPHRHHVFRRNGSSPCGNALRRERLPHFFWDNAYCVHHLYDDEREHVADIAAACEAAGNPNRYFKFASTSKVTLPGAGIAAVAASAENIAEIKARVGVQTVGYDKMNQLRHVRFLKNAAGVDALMKKHAAIIRPKFELVARMLEEGLVSNEDIATWTNPVEDTSSASRD